MSERRINNYRRSDNRISPRDIDLFTVDPLIKMDPETKDAPPIPSNRIATKSSAANIRPTTEISKLVADATATQKQLAGMTASIMETLDPDNSAAGLFGRFAYGTELRETINPDGSIETHPWTMQDILELERENYPSSERETRKSLTRELIIGLRQQLDFFTTSEHPRLTEVEAVIDFTTALTQRILASEESITEVFMPSKSVTYDAAEMIEIIRRTILEPHYMIIEGFAQGAIRVIPSYDDDIEFWDLSNQREDKIRAQMKDPENHDEFMRVQEQVALTNPENHDTEKWEEILDKETVYLYEFALTFARRTRAEFHRGLNFLTSLTDGGQPIYSEEQLSNLRAKANTIDKIAREMEKLSSFQQLQDFIKQTFGQDANSQTLFQALRPIDLDHKPEFKYKYPL